MNQKAKPHEASSVVGVQNLVGVLGLCRFISEEFGVKAKPRLAYMLVDRLHELLTDNELSACRYFGWVGSAFKGCEVNQL